MQTNNLDLNLSETLRTAIEQQAERYALSPDDVARLAIEAGLPRISGHASKMQKDRELKQQLESLLPEYTYAEIGDRMGLTRQAVHYQCERLGLVNPRGPGRQRAA